MMLPLERGQAIGRDQILRKLVEIQYERNDHDFGRGTFRVRGDVVDVYPSYEEIGVRIELFGDQVDELITFDPLTGQDAASGTTRWRSIPKSHFVAPRERTKAAVETDQGGAGLVPRRSSSRKASCSRRSGVHQRTMFDLEMINEIGYCHGIENYARHLTGRAPGDPPPTLLDYLPEDALLIVDESHQTVPQVRGMYAGDRSRKEVLVAYGFRLPSALDNRPLNFAEWEARVGQVVYVSATPGPYELAKSQGVVVEQIIRPTGLIDPPIDVRPVKGQVDDLLQEIRARVGAARARAGDHADQADGRGPDAVLSGARRPRPLPALGHRDARARRDPPRPAPRRVRRPGRDQPAARGARSAGGVAGGHPRRGQGRLPAVGGLADSDVRPRGAQRQRPRDHMRRQDDRLDARGDVAKPRAGARIQEAYNAEHGITPQSIVKQIDEVMSSVYERDYLTPATSLTDGIGTVQDAGRARPAHRVAAGRDEGGGREPRLREGRGASR